MAVRSEGENVPFSSSTVILDALRVQNIPNFQVFRSVVVYYISFTKQRVPTGDADSCGPEYQISASLLRIVEGFPYVLRVVLLPVKSSKFTVRSSLEGLMRCAGL